MAGKEPDRLDVLEFVKRRAELMSRVQYNGERFVIRRHGKEAAALISIEDLRLLERLTREEEDRIDVAAARAAREENDG